MLMRKYYLILHHTKILIDVLICSKDSDAENLIESLVNLGNTEKIRIQRMLKQDAQDNEDEEDDDEESEEEEEEDDSDESEEESRGETQEEDEEAERTGSIKTEDVDTGIEMRSFKESNTVVSPPAKQATVGTNADNILDTGDQLNIVGIVLK